MNDDSISRAQKRFGKQLEADMAKCLLHGPTRRVFALLIDQTGVFAYPGAADPAAEYRNGRRSVGLDLVGMVQASDPLAFVKLQQELITARQADQRGIEQESDDE